MSFGELIPVEPFDLPTQFEQKYEIIRGNTLIAIVYDKPTFTIDTWYYGLPHRVGKPRRFDTSDFFELVRRNPVLNNYRLGPTGRAEDVLLVILEREGPEAFIVPRSTYQMLSTMPASQMVTEIRKLASNQVISAESSKQFKPSEKTGLSIMLPKVQETKRMFEEKAEDLQRSDGHTIENAINSFLAFCESDAIMRSVTQPLTQNTNVNITKWHDNLSKSRSFILPTNDDDKVALLYQLLLKIRSNEIKYYDLELGGRDINQAAYQFNNAVSRPLIRGLSNEINKRAVSSQASPRSVPVGLSPDSSPDPQSVFVVSGRNEKLRLDFFSFLRSVGLKPIEFSKAVTLTGKGAPYIGEILDAAFRNAQAVVVLMSPDDEARLKEEFQSERDESYEKELTAQPRQNVLFEAGFAFGYKPDRTILVKVGELRPFSDIYGRHEVRLTNDPARRQDLVNRLKEAGCVAKTEGTDWLTIGEFESISPLSEKTSVPEAGAGIIDSLGKQVAPRIGMQEAKRIALEQVRLERPESKNAKVDSAQLVGKNWVISGSWTESGPRSFGTTNFEVVIDSVTREISKVGFTSGFAMAVG